MQRTYGTGWFKSAHPVVREGDRNDTVKHLQGLLNITADGVFGSGTKRAVVAVQQRAGLPADGIVGPDTWSRLHTVVKQGVSGPAVQEVQRQVGVADDGAFGPGTHAAVVSYQRGAGLAADGIVGPGTYRAMMR
jgi:peptidoglycan hydrolase-like protein with peptidoglycan-binding domain